MFKTVSRSELVNEYCTRQEATPEDLAARLADIKSRYNASGFMLLECQQFDSSFFASFTILPFGGNATFKTVPVHAVSPRGLASDMSIVVMVSE